MLVFHVKQNFPNAPRTADKLDKCRRVDIFTSSFLDLFGDDRRAQLRTGLHHPQNGVARDHAYNLRVIRA
jgi:hypothetical protein